MHEIARDPHAALFLFDQRAVVARLVPICIQHHDATLTKYILVGRQGLDLVDTADSMRQRRGTHAASELGLNYAINK